MAAIVTAPRVATRQIPIVRVVFTGVFITCIMVSVRIPPSSLVPTAYIPVVSGARYSPEEVFSSGVQFNCVDPA